MAASWKRRVLAFAVDYAIFGALWSAIDNLIIVPVDEGLMSFGGLALFCLYFGLTEGTGSKSASPGKRLLGLAVTLRDGWIPSAGVVAARAAILGLILVPDWQRVISLSLEDVPSQVFVLTMTVPAGLGLYNVWLGFRGTEGLMLQDGLTYSKVVAVASLGTDTGTEGHLTQQQRRWEWPRPMLSFSLIVTLSVLGIMFFQYIGGSELFNLMYGLQRDLERTIATVYGVRARVVAGKRVAYSPGKEPTRTLGISVWLPFRGWKEELVEPIAQTSIATVALSPKIRREMFESGEVTLTRELGIGGFFGFLQFGSFRRREFKLTELGFSAQMEPTDAQTYVNRGGAYYWLGEYRRAIKDFDQAIRLDPTFAPAYYNRGDAFLRLGKVQRTIQDADQAIRLDPNFALAYYDRSLAYAQLNQPDRACQDMRKACDLGLERACPFVQPVCVWQQAGSP